MHEPASNGPSHVHRLRLLPRHSALPRVGWGFPCLAEPNQYDTGNGDDSSTSKIDQEKQREIQR